jgi:hypothetical protein
MPMELTHGTFLKMLLSSGNVCAGGKICNDLLAHPSPVEDPRPGIREAPLEVGHHAIVGALSPQVVGVLQVDLLVRSTCVSHECELKIIRAKAIPRITAPLPLASIGSPCANCCLFSSVGLPDTTAATIVRTGIKLGFILET